MGRHHCSWEVGVGGTPGVSGEVHPQESQADDHPREVTGRPRESKAVPLWFLDLRHRWESGTWPAGSALRDFKP